MSLAEKFNFYLILAIFLIFPLGQLTRITIFSPEIHIYWHDILIIVLLLHCFTVSLFSRKRKFFGLKLTKYIISFFIIALFSLLLDSYKFSLSQITISSLYLFRWLAYAIIFFTVVRFSKKQKRKISEFLIFAGIAAAVFGLFQYFFLPDARDLVAAGWDPHLYRVIGTFLDPGFTGLIYVFTLILLADFVWNKTNRINKTNRAFCFLLFAFCYSALALSYARSAYLAFLVAAWILAYLKKSAKFGLAMTLLLLVTLPLLPRPAGEGVKLERQNSIWSRLDSYKNAIDIWRENPVFGIGFNTYRYVQAEKGLLGKDWQSSHAASGTDSSLLFVLATTGIVGLTVYLNLLFGMIKMALKNRSYILLPTLIALFIHSFFNNSLFYPWMMIWGWVLLALASKKIKNEK